MMKALTEEKREYDKYGHAGRAVMEAMKTIWQQQYGGSSGCGAKESDSKK